MNVMIVQL